MSKKFRKAFSILKDDGLATLFHKTYLQFYKTRFDPEYIISKIIGRRTISIGDAKVEVDISNIGAYNEMKFITNNEVSIIRDILKEVNEEDVFLDIGANMGVHSIFVDEKAEAVYSIEPHPVNLSFLNINLIINNSDINIYACGFSNSKGYTKISGPRNNMEVDGCASIKRYNDKNEHTISVRLEKGDKFIQQNGLEVPRIIKIDVEGAEMNVLWGLESIIAHSDCRVIYCEVHDDEFREINDFLNSFGYSTNIIGDGRMIKGVKE